jgi:CRP/FNR family transcriptional regulator, anaerobic regulatory protein
MTWYEDIVATDPPDGQAGKTLQDLQPFAFAAGTVLFHPGDTVSGFLVLLRGRIDVFLTGRTGREVRLYTVERGDTCVQTTLGLLGGEAYSAEGVAATDGEAVLIPRSLFLTLMQQSPAFAHFVFGAFASRLQNLMQLLEDVAFLPIEQRLARALVDMASGNRVTATHQDLANQIGSAREVVSRKLELFARRGLVATERGRISLLDRAALRHLAAGEAAGD